MIILETIFLSRQVLFELKTNELKIQIKCYVDRDFYNLSKH